VSKILTARIRFLGPGRGGIPWVPRSGVRPLLRVGNAYTSTVVWTVTGESAFELERDYDVALEVMFWEEYSEQFVEGMSVELFDGSRKVAEGVFLEPVAGREP
jgi:hypothetical protein